MQDGESSILAKGIDAFSEDNVVRRGRKGKRKAKGIRGLEDDSRSSSLDLNNSSGAATPINKWQSAGEDVDFIATRSGIPVAAVRSAYYSHNASVPETIGYLLKQNIDPKQLVTSDDTVVQRNAVDLGHDFPTIAPDYLVALIRLTHPSTASAHELAKALTKKSAGAGGSIQVVPRYERPRLSDDEYEPLKGKKKGTRSAASSASPPLGYADASGFASSYRDARYAALAQAQAAYRRSRSDHLMAGAAGYYASVGREHATASMRYSSAAADALVDSQSTAYQLDLHGVNVQDAIRISRSRVESWWSGLGESRINGRQGADDRARGFNIVTGIGRHSEGGKGKLGPAVTKALTADGWRVEGNSGSILVKGRARAA